MLKVIKGGIHRDGLHSRNMPEAVVIVQYVFAMHALQAGEARKVEVGELGAIVGTEIRHSRLCIPIRAVWIRDEVNDC